MTNNYLLFSTQVWVHAGVRTAAVKKMLEDGVAAQKAACAADDYEQAEKIGFDFSYGWDRDGSLVLYSEENGNVDHAAMFIQMLMNKKWVSEPRIISYAETCSTSRPDEFGGGAILVTRAKLHYFDARRVAETKWDALKNLKTKTKKPRAAAKRKK